MKIKDLLNQYKVVSREMRDEAKKYNSLSSAVMCSCSEKTFAEYEKSWSKLISLNEKAYGVMYEYRKLCGSPLYKVMFFLGVLPKQNSFRFVDGSKTQFKFEQMINLIDLK